jgi:hypothetical protein
MGCCGKSKNTLQCTFMEVTMVVFYAPPSSLIDSTVSPKVKTTEGEKVGVRSLVCSTLGVKGCVRAPGWD